MASKSIPISISSTLTNVTPVETLSVNTHENTTATAAQAPILLTYASETSVDSDTFAEKMVETGGQGTVAQARLILNAIPAVIKAFAEQYGAVTINTCFGTITTSIAGTIAEAHDDLDEETNTVSLAIEPPTTLQKMVGQITARVKAGTCPATLKRVRDKATGDQSIDGKNAFYLEGKGMTFGGTGEKLELLNATTLAKVCDAAVTDHASTIQFACNLNPEATVAKGSYVLRLTTLAGDESTLWPLDLKVVLSADAVKEG